MQNALVAISEKALFDSLPHVASVFFILRFFSLEKEHRKRAYAMAMREAQKNHCGGVGRPFPEKAEAIIAEMYAWEKQYLWEQLSLIASI